MGYELIIFAALAFGALWLMSSRSRKQQQQANAFRDNLQIGQEVRTASGMFGTIVAVEDDIITLESVPGSESRWLRAAIALVVEPPVEDEGDEEYEDDETEWVDDDGDDADEVIEVPDDLSTLPPVRGDDDSDGTKKQ